MRNIIIQFDNEIGESTTVNWLRHLNKRNKNDFDIQTLREIIHPDLRKFLKHPVCEGFSERFKIIGREHIRDPFALIWEPNSQDVDWFKNLTENGYSGKKVLVHSGLVSTSFDMGERFGQYANISFELLTRKLPERIYEFLAK